MNSDLFLPVHQLFESLHSDRSHKSYTTNTQFSQLCSAHLSYIFGYLNLSAYDCQHMHNVLFDQIALRCENKTLQMVRIYHSLFISVL